MDKDRTLLATDHQSKAPTLFLVSKEIDMSHPDSPSATDNAQKPTDGPIKHNVDADEPEEEKDQDTDTPDEDVEDEDDDEAEDE